MTTPTPGQPLSEADVSLLQPGDILRLDHGGGLHRFLRAKSKSSRLICAVKVRGSVERFYDRYRFTFVERPHAPVSRPGDGVEGRTPGQVAYEGWAQGLPGCEWSNQTATQKRAWEKAAQAVAALTPPAEPASRPAGEGETTQHTPRCWGRTSYSDEMAHCYCKPAGEGEREAVAWPVVTDQWAETYCELTGRDPDGQQVTFVDGATVTTFRDMARREIEAMLCAAPKSAVRTIATAEPAEARIRELVDQLLKTERDYSELRQSYDAVVAKLTTERAHGNKQYRRVTATAAKLARAVEGFGVITDLSVNLRRGGPDSSDLNDLSDALDTAVSVAAETLASLQQGTQDQ